MEIRAINRNNGREILARLRKKPEIKLKLQQKPKQPKVNFYRTA